jgi:hypothetical protein
MTGTEELRSEKSQSQGAHERFFLIFIREGQVWEALSSLRDVS